MRYFVCFLAALLLMSSLHAHVVPNMTIEAEFAADHSYTLKLNLDPRVFLSDQPTSLPPVSADWYLSQNDEQKTATYEKATEYLKTNVGLTFNDHPIPLPSCEFIAMDGATNEEVKPDTAETHLLATAHGSVPPGSESFKIAFGKAANVSLILLNSEEGNEDKRPQVLFPGETSRPFKISKVPELEKAEIELKEVTVQKGLMIGTLFVPASLFAASCAFGVVLLAALAFMLRPKRR